jgi:hypothetical protein
MNDNNRETTHRLLFDAYAKVLVSARVTVGDVGAPAAGVLTFRIEVE